jgi:hypothetical protein
MRRCYGDADVREGGVGEVVRSVDRVGPRHLMPLFFTDDEIVVLRVACDRLIPEDETSGATSAAVPDYIDGLLAAFLFDPPRIWAGGPTSGRQGGEAAFTRFHSLSRLDELAWRIRIEGSQGIPEREFNGPVVGLQDRYREGLAGLGADFCDLAPEDQDERLRSRRDFTAVLYEHCCEGMYGAPEYGGNRDGAGWEGIEYPGDVQPRGWSDAEVAGP